MTASEEYNAMPIEVRRITGRILAEHQLRDLRIERDRAVRTYKRHIAEIDEHIKNVKECLSKDGNHQD